jgi:hydrogenase maturation protein HypF
LPERHGSANLVEFHDHLNKRPVSVTIEAALIRCRLTVAGQVQGVGFRPAVYRLAVEGSLTGFVRNAPEGVIIEIQGMEADVRSYPDLLRLNLPPLARMTSLEATWLPPISGEQDFRIRESAQGEGHHVLISPDMATCEDCLRELFDPRDRRHFYPFINCTNCGPRLTITAAIPYDRPQTSMACFAMCPDCVWEYEDPLNRRFHAQPNACPVCGPQVWLTDRLGHRLAERDNALVQAARALADGRILAVKGLGGFHLVCAADSNPTVAELRRRKHRWEKPLAVMVPDLTTALDLTRASPADQDLLASPQRPIVLLPVRADALLSMHLAPDTERIGLMLAYTPLHHVLLAHYRKCIGPDRIPALVATSGNLSSEPIALGNREALTRLESIADLFVLHDRDILVRCDDSVARVHPVTKQTEFFRRARGFTPSPVFLARKGPCVLGLGPELKATICLTKHDQAFVSQHLGDLENLETFQFYRESIAHLQAILQVRPEALACDLHPDYMSTAHGREQPGLPLFQVQHHAAHIHAVLAENLQHEPALGLALDGAGLGDDGTIWGGEALLVNPGRPEYQRLGHLAPVLMPGGELAARQPWRMARSYLWSIGEKAPRSRPWPWLADFTQADTLAPVMLERRINSPVTTSCGRLFDAVAGLLGVKLVMAYEGQAAIALERIQDHGEQHAYACPLRSDGEPLVLDTLELFRQVHQDWLRGVTPALISRRFHLGLVQGLTDLAASLAVQAGLRHVALSGGVLHNLTVSQELPRALAARGLTPLVHALLPPGDACISLGQAICGRMLLEQD